MKKRLLAALAAAFWLIGAFAAADDGEAQERARQERVDGYLAAQFGADWAQTVAAYEDYDLGATAEDSTLFAILTKDGRNTLFVLNYADGEQVSAYACPNALRQDEIPAFSFELENEIGFVYSDGSAQTYALGPDGRWRLNFYCAQENTLAVSLKPGPLIEYTAGDEPARGEIAGWAQMPRPRTLTLVPVDAAGNEYPEAAMEFTLDR